MHDPLGLKQRLKAATRSLPPCRLSDSRKAGAIPSPLWGGPTRGEAPSEEGGAGHRAPGRSRPALHQPQGQGPRDPQAPAPAADGLESPRRRWRSMPSDPPSRSAFGRVGPPHKGEEECVGEPGASPDSVRADSALAGEERGERLVHGRRALRGAPNASPRRARSRGRRRRTRCSRRRGRARAPGRAGPR